MAIHVFFRLSKRGLQIHKYWKKTEHHNFILPGTIIEVWICNICEIIPIQHQGCQLLSKFFDNMDYIIIKNLLITIQSQFFQLLATVRNKAEFCPIYLLKRKHLISSTKRQHIVVLFTSHYTYNCIKLMHNKKVFYTRILFCLLYLHNKAGNVRIT